MPRKLEHEPLTAAQRQARQRQRRAERHECWRLALVRIAEAKSIGEARRIATEALKCGEDT